jgi:NitT/TauT family transport system substrate-binding protein
VNTSLDTVRVAAAGAGTYYYPQFVARALGFFADEGLNVEVDVLGGGPGVPRSVASGKADIGLGGIWSTLMYREHVYRDPPEAPFAFAQMCIRSPGIVLAREPQPGFEWAALEGKVLVSPVGSPGPLLLLHDILRNSRVKPDRVRFIQDFQADEASTLFRGGMGDLFVAMPPLAEQLQDAGVGCEVANLASLGEYPWSVFFARKEFLDRTDRAAGRFATAIRRALQWCLAHEPEEEPAIAQRHFPNLRLELVAASVRACRNRGLWIDSVRVDEPALTRWQELIVEGGYIDAPRPFADAVDSRAADQAHA